MELPDPVRQRLSNLSLTVFGDSSRTGPESTEAAGEWRGRRPTRGCGSRAGERLHRRCPGERWRLRLQDHEPQRPQLLHPPGGAVAARIGMRSRKACVPTRVTAAPPAWQPPARRPVEKSLPDSHPAHTHPGCVQTPLSWARPAAANPTRPSSSASCFLLPV